MKYVVVIDLDGEEKGLVINALTLFRNKLIREEIDTSSVDALLLKLLDAPQKKKMFHKLFGEAR